MIETERLLLRPWRESDFHPTWYMSNDATVMEFFPKMLNRDETGAMIDRFQKHYDQYGYGFLAVELKETGEFIGMNGLWNNTELAVPFVPCMEIGWRLARKHWQKGYATEGARAWIDYAFQQLNVDEVVALVALGNEKSQAVMRRLGMTTNSQENFDHPRMPADHKHRKHALFRLKNKTL